jgi:hypothetical protein
MKRTRILSIALSAISFSVPGIASAQHHDLTHDQPAVTDAFVHFGIVPTEPLGPPPCRQTAPFGLPIGATADECVHLAHRLSPEEVTVVKGGQVTYQMHNGGHSVAIYEVSKDTTRQHIGQSVCPGADPLTIITPTEHVCGSSKAANADAPHLVTDGKNDVVLMVPTLGPYPDTVVTYLPGRLMSAAGALGLNGQVPIGHVVSYQFLKTGRYLVICMNRSHFLSDWMFGFVNVVGD